MINSKYVNALNLFSHDIDEELQTNKETIVKEMSSAKLNYDDFILSKLNPDGEIPSYVKIVEKIKENFFK